MFNSKYNNVLTIILIIVIILVIVLVGIFGYKYFSESKEVEEAKSAVDNFQSETSKNNGNASEEVNKPEEVKQEENNTNISEQINSVNTGSGSSSNKTHSYKGYEMIGTIEIPKIDVSYPILSQNAYSKSALETSICKLYGTEPNEVGNMVLVGHNYRNSKFFSNNKKLNNGDKIYIADVHGNKVEYTIYNKYETTDNDTEYMTRDTAGKREISLSTCTDDGKLRLVIWAVAN